MKIPDDFIPERILIIQLRQLGDVLLTTPVIRALRENLPNAHIAFLTEENARDVLSGNPYLDEIIAIERRQSYMDQLKVIAGIRKRRFDLLLDFFANPRSAYIALFSGARTVSLDLSVRGLLYDMRVEAAGGYNADQKLCVLSAIGLESKDNKPYIHLPEKAAEEINSFLSAAGVEEDDFLICIDSTHRRVVRKWTGHGFASVADKLSEQYGAKIVFLWGPGEKEEVEKIMGMCRHKHILSPQTSIKEAAALIRRAGLLIGNCSFPRHVAAAVGTPSLIILGATGEEWTYPASIHRTVRKGLPCQPCNIKACEKGLECLNTLSADEVMKSFEEILPCLGKRTTKIVSP